MSKGKLSTSSVAEGIIATVDACRCVVKAFASGRVTTVICHGMRDADLRYAPRFARDLPADTIGVKYTTGHIVEYLQMLGKDTSVDIGNGRRAPSRWMLLSMLLLEMWELELRDQESDIIFIAEGRIGFTLNALLGTCRKQYEKHRALVEKQQEATAILELCK